MSPRPPEERAIRVAIACSVFGGVIKCVAGAATGSMSLISSAADSLGDLFVSAANLGIVRYGHRPADEDHNYGHAKIEAVGAMFEGGFIFAAGAFIAFETVRKAVRGEATHDPGLGILAMLPVLAVTVGTVMYLRKVAHATGSLVVRSDAVHYLTDVWVNVGVLVSLVLVRVTGKAWVDWVVSAVIAAYMIHSSRGVVQEGFDVLMDKSLEPDVVARVTAALQACPRIDSFHDLRTRRGRHPSVDFHAVVPPEMTAQELHDLYSELRAQIRAIVGPGTGLHMHADPSTGPDSDPEDLGV